CPVECRENVGRREVAADVAGVREVHELEVLDADLPGGLGDVGDLVRSAGVGAEPAEDGHGDVLNGEGAHAGPASVAALSAMQLSRTCWTRRCAVRASWLACAVRNVCSSSASSARCRALRKRIAAFAASTLSSRNGNWSSCQTPSQLFLRRVWKNSNVSTRCTEPTTMSSSQPRKLSLTSIANSLPASMQSCAASAGVSSPYREWPKSSRMPRFSNPTCWMASRVRAAFGKMILLRGSRGLYSMTNRMSGWAETSSRSPPTASCQMSW